MFGIIGHILPHFVKHFHCMPEMMGHEEFPEIKKEMLELYKKFLEMQIKHIDNQLKTAEEKDE
jgi:hypothetical protein